MRNWTQEEMEIVRQCYASDKPDIDGCSTKLNRSREAVKSMAARLNVSNPKTITPEEEAFIKEHSQSQSMELR